MLVLMPLRALAAPLDRQLQGCAFVPELLRRTPVGLRHVHLPLPLRVGRLVLRGVKWGSLAPRAATGGVRLGVVPEPGVMQRGRFHGQDRNGDVVNCGVWTI